MVLASSAKKVSRSVSVRDFYRVSDPSDFPEVGQVILSSWTLFPRYFSPVGQNFLGKCVPLTHFPMDIFSYDTGTVGSVPQLYPRGGSDTRKLDSTFVKFA